MFVTIYGTERGLLNNFIIYTIGIEDYERYRIKIKRKKGRKWGLD